MELKQYLYNLLKRIWLLILLPIMCGGFAAYISMYKMLPVYESSTTLLVISKDDNNMLPLSYENVLVDQKLVMEYKEIVKSRTVTKMVIDELNIKNINPERLAANINVVLRNDTRILEIKVQDNSPEVAQILTDKISEVFIRRAAELMYKEGIAIIDKAEKPTRPVKPKHKYNIVIGAAAGLLIALIIIFVLEELDSTIKTVDDIEKKLGFKVIGTIPKLKIKK